MGEAGRGTRRPLDSAEAQAKGLFSVDALDLARAFVEASAHLADLAVFVPADIRKTDRLEGGTVDNFGLHGFSFLIGTQTDWNAGFLDRALHLDHASL